MVSVCLDRTTPPTVGSADGTLARESDPGAGGSTGIPGASHSSRWMLRAWEAGWYSISAFAVRPIASQSAGELVEVMVGGAWMAGVGGYGGWMDGWRVGGMDGGMGGWGTCCC